MSARRSVLRRTFSPAHWAGRRARQHENFDRPVKEHAAFHRVANRVAAGERLDDVFAAVCRETADLLDAPLTALIREESGGREAIVSAVGLSAPSTHRILAGADLALPVRIEAPVVIKGRRWGALVAGWTKPGRIRPGSTDRLAWFAELVAIAVAGAQRHSELVASRTRIIASADLARRRLERDLHDGAQQRLVMLALDLRAAEAAVPPELGELKTQLGKAAGDLAAAVRDLQETARGIHPVILTQGGLRPALKALARRCPLPVHRQFSVDGRLPEGVEVALYYVASEALTNVVKHSGAGAVWIELRIEGSSVLLSVSDDGVGGAAPSGGSGLAGLRDRIEALGGWLAIGSPPGQGTTVTAGIPL